MKKTVSLWLCAAVLLSSQALAQQSPPPTQTPGLGPYQGSGTATDVWPGDPHRAVNAQWIGEKANDVIWFLNRQNSNLNQKQTDASFWGTNWGFASFTPTGDGRIYYDPYGPSGCSTGGGRWLVSELGTMKYSDGTYQGGFVWAISQSSDPTSWWTWWTADPNARNNTICSGNNLCPSDYPQLGFNTNFIAITSHLFYANGDPELFIFPKGPAECSGSIATWLNVDNPSVDLANPAETYFTNGQDLDGSTLYLVNTVETPLSVVFPFLTGDLFWLGPGATTLGQYVATQKSPQASPPLTAFSFLFQAAPTWAAQWWQIGIDGSSALSANRIGGYGLSYDSLNTNALDPTIAVNNEGDALIGFSEVSPSNYLSAAYVLKPASSSSEDTPYIYQPGNGPYMGVNGDERRPGDYSHTAVDPTDDFTFWTATDFAGPALDSTVSNARGWRLTWAWVAP